MAVQVERLVEDILSLPPHYRDVIANCIAEAGRNLANNDPGASSDADVAADIAQHLVDVYDVVTYPKESI